MIGVEPIGSGRIVRSGPKGGRLDEVARVPLHREAVRVVLVDHDDRLLLLRGADPARPAVRYWFTPGGGLEAGEDLGAAAVREVHEETGLRLDPAELIGTGHHETTEFGFGQFWVVQRQEYLLARVAPFEAVPVALEEAEALSVDTLAWWSRRQVADQQAGVVNDGPGLPDESIYPPELAQLLDGWLGAAG
jgi:8-oxo-dGTP pyrophosphatase MutT (NUDIX family)